MQITSALDGKHTTIGRTVLVRRADELDGGHQVGPFLFAENLHLKNIRILKIQWSACNRLRWRPKSHSSGPIVRGRSLIREGADINFALVSQLDTPLGNKPLRQECLIEVDCNGLSPCAMKTIPMPSLT